MEKIKSSSAWMWKTSVNLQSKWTTGVEHSQNFDWSQIRAGSRNLRHQFQLGKSHQSLSSSRFLMIESKSWKEAAWWPPSTDCLPLTLIHPFIRRRHQLCNFKVGMKDRNVWEDKKKWRVQTSVRQTEHCHDGWSQDLDYKQVFDRNMIFNYMNRMIFHHFDDFAHDQSETRFPFVELMGITVQVRQTGVLTVKASCAVPGASLMSYEGRLWSVPIMPHSHNMTHRHCGAVSRHLVQLFT